MSLRFSDVFSLQMGKTPARNNPAYWGGTQNWISISDMNDKYISKTREQISDAAISETGIKLVPKGTVIMSFKLSIGKVSITAEDTYTNEAIMAFINKGIYDIDNDYLYHYLKAQDWSVGSNKAVKGSTLNKSVLEKRDISFPSKTEQQKISYKLNLADEAISRCRQIEDTLDQLIKSRFVEMFGDPESNDMKLPVVKMGELFTIGSSKRIYQNEQTKSGVPFLRIADLTEIIETGNNVPSLYISKERYENLKQNGYVPNPGDILVTARGTLGSCYIVKKTDKFYFQDGMISWMYNMRQDVSANYIYYLFHMPGFRKQFGSTIAGSTVSYLSIAMLKKLEVLLPPLSAQNDFAAFVHEIDKSKLAVKECLEKAEYLKSALMQEYFG